MALGFQFCACHAIRRRGRGLNPSNPVAGRRANAGEAELFQNAARSRIVVIEIGADLVDLRVMRKGGRQKCLQSFGGIALAPMIRADHIAKVAGIAAHTDGLTVTYPQSPGQDAFSARVICDDQSSPLYLHQLPRPNPAPRIAGPVS